MTPSPQVVTQIEGSRSQLYPRSIAQVVEQPSPLAVFPSSQVSPGSTSPSLQTVRSTTHSYTAGVASELPAGSVAMTSIR